LESGVDLTKLRVPLGVVAVVYEARPNVTIDCAALTIKSGNAIVLRGSRYAERTNGALAAIVREALAEAGLPEDAAVMLAGGGHEDLAELATQEETVDLLIPRGGEGLKNALKDIATVPVIFAAAGNCHVYVHADADLEMAQRIAVNAKTQRPGVCNAIETVLVHREIAAPFFKKIAPILAEKKVEMRADPDSFLQLSALSYQLLRPARDEDWTTEYLDLILATRTVDNIENAIEHIEKCGSHHSDVIITRDIAGAEKFLNEVDSATVYWNASTRFTDGAEFGFGAEIGISTDKLHARGPMALEELTTYKYVIRGEGQIRG
jgi:glutamate-5-semialdehyde dehydrogenase